MNLRELLTTVDQLRPNAFTDAEKIRMVNTVEGRIYKDILSKYEGEEPVFVPFAEGQEERELVVPVPFHGCVCVLSHQYDGFLQRGFRQIQRQYDLIQ